MKEDVYVSLRQLEKGVSSKIIYKDKEGVTIERMFTFEGFDAFHKPLIFMEDSKNYLDIERLYHQYDLVISSPEPTGQC